MAIKIKITIAAITETTAPEEDPWVMSLDALRNRSNFLNPDKI